MNPTGATWVSNGTLRVGPNLQYYHLVWQLLAMHLLSCYDLQGLQAIVYLDDGILAVSGRQAAIEASEKVRQNLANAGLVENTAKSNWLLSQKICWLDFNLDLAAGQSQKEIHSPKVSFAISDKCEGNKAKPLASIIGEIVSMSLDLGPVTQLMTRSLYSLLNSRRYWCESLTIPPNAKEELLFWADSLDTFNGQGIWHSPSAVRVLYSDARYGGYSVEHGYHMAYGLWTQEEATRNST